MTTFEIVKIPLEEQEKEESIKQFRRMPILYLELIENKSKVKPELINKPYEPPRSKSSVAEIPFEQEKEENVAQEEKEPEPLPPTLEELHAKNPEEQILKKEFAHSKPDDDETAKKKSEVYFHYQVLKRMHPNAPIPEFTQYSDPEIMSKKYEMIAKKLALDSSVENWKRYMIIFVMGLEVVLGKLSFDVEGFAQQQLVQMHTYDSLLVEIAEKSYTPTGTSKWPVEVRLMMMLTVNMALFVICKMIQKKTGTNLLGTINGLTNPSSERLIKPPSDQK